MQCHFTVTASHVLAAILLHGNCRETLSLKIRGSKELLRTRPEDRSSFSTNNDAAQAECMKGLWGIPRPGKRKGARWRDLKQGLEAGASSLH